MTEHRPHRQSVTLDEETLQRLRGICERHGVQISGAVRIAVKALEDDHEPPLDRAEALAVELQDRIRLARESGV